MRPLTLILRAAEAITDKGAPVWLTVLALLIGSGTATGVLIQTIASRGKNKAETTKTIIDGLNSTLTTYNDSLLKANERVKHANERADALDEKLRAAEERERILEEKNEKLERDSRDLRRQIDELTKRVATLAEEVRLCREMHSPPPSSPQVP